jgi:hypothetical protein
MNHISLDGYLVLIKDVFENFVWEPLIFQIPFHLIQFYLSGMQLRQNIEILCAQIVHFFLKILPFYLEISYLRA